MNHKPKKKLLVGNEENSACTCSMCEQKEFEDHEIPLLWLLWSILFVVLIGIGLVVFSIPAHSSEFSDTQIANAIFKAEGINSRHPYGILASYKHTTPRQACLNTIKNKRKQWINEGANGSFIAFLGSKYCPVGASNDPTGLNKNWTRLVSYFLEKDA